MWHDRQCYLVEESQALPLLIAVSVEYRFRQRKRALALGTLRSNGKDDRARTNESMEQRGPATRRERIQGPFVLVRLALSRRACETLQRDLRPPKWRTSRGIKPDSPSSERSGAGAIAEILRIPLSGDSEAAGQGVSEKEKEKKLRASTQLRRLTFTSATSSPDSAPS